MKLWQFTSAVGADVEMVVAEDEIQARKAIAAQRRYVVSREQSDR